MDTAKKLSIAVSEEDADNIERLKYETDSRASLISIMMANPDFETTEFQASFKKYHEEYVKVFKEFSEAKTALDAKYIQSNENFAGKNILSWNLEFATKQLVVRYAD
jgi:hypothetical protein